MPDFIKYYLITLLAFCVLDGLWLGLIARNFYRNQIGFLLNPHPNWAAAILFYLLFIAGLTFFVVQPGIEKGNLLQAILRGGFFGLITYATYDLTNLATIDRWPLLVTAVDLCWGTVLSALTVWAGVWLGMK